MFFMKRLRSLLLLVAMVYSLGTVVFASSNVGYGQGVSDVPPDIPVVIFGASPPSSSNGYVDLGTYDGEIAYLCKGSLYSNKWVRSSTTTIKIDSEFRSYGSQVGCENRTNPLTIPQNMEVNLIASDGTKIAKTVSASSNATTTFTVKANTQYYVHFRTSTGNWVGGDFTVYK